MRFSFWIKKLFYVFFLNVALLAITCNGYSQNPSVVAFPGAEGYGANTPGGRGGKVYIVSNLEDNGIGSFREACEAEGPRIVVFNVSGIIDLKTPVVISNPYITIAGQTAPGMGICLKRRELRVFTHNVIVRCLRSRPGDVSGEELDAISVGKDAHDVILDHCSANWSVDEGLSPSGNIYNITIQWCLIGQSLQKSVHKKGEHGFGSLVRGVGGMTLHHNLWINNTARNPRLGDNYNKPPWPTIDVRNNVMYNWGKMCSGMTGGNVSANYVFNYLKPGPASSLTAPIVLTATSKVKFYLEGNIVEGRPQYDKNNDTWFDASADKTLKLYDLMDKPFVTAPVITVNAKQAYKDVLAKVGAIFPTRDAVDARLITQVRTNTGKMIDSQNEIGGWPTYPSVKPQIDSDKDGIPDAWEISHGLNPKDSKDSSEISKNNHGYSNIEVYINQLCK